MLRGVFILFEGGDRAGKSTQCRRLVDHLNANGIVAQHRRFPDRTTTIGKMIDAYLAGSTQLDDRAIHLLFSANRWEAVANMKADLQKGITLVVDRYAYSGVAFSAAKGLSLSWCKQPDVGLLRPDLVCLLDMPVEKAALRGDFGQERYERVELQERVRTYFSQLREPSWLVLNATESIESLHETIVEHAMKTQAVCKNMPIYEDLWQTEEHDADKVK